MANYGLFIGWNRPVPGREPEAGEVFQQALGYWGKLQKEGKIESFEPALLQRHGGDLNGFFLIRGKRESIHTIMDSREYKDLILRCDHYVAGFGVVPMSIGEELTTEMQHWMQLVTKS